MKRIPFDSVLEIRVKKPALRSEEGEINPPMAFQMEVEARFSRVEESEWLGNFSTKVRSQDRKFTEWAANDARLLREEIDASVEQVAARIVEHFGLRNLPGAIPLQLAGSSN